MTDLSKRELFALRYAEDQYHPGHWFQAHQVASAELRAVRASNDEAEQDRIRKLRNPAIGWGHTLLQLHRKGLIARRTDGFTWSYQITPNGRVLLAEPAEGAEKTEQAATPERTGARERAGDVEGAEGRERAAGAESTVHGERAAENEGAEEDERAAARESTEPPEHDPQRYRIYLVNDQDKHPHEVASTPTPGGIGVALVTMHEDALEAGGHLWDDGRIGVQDTLTGEWIVHPWPRGLSRT